MSQSGGAGFDCLFPKEDAQYQAGVLKSRQQPKDGCEVVCVFPNQAHGIITLVFGINYFFLLASNFSNSFSYSSATASGL